MLEGLCGNKNVQRVLLFLFVNGRCYGTQLQRAFQTSLTPLQKTLSRLERNGLIISYYEGKTRLYRFNPTYPLLEELEQLLKKAYTLLPAQQKKACYALRDNPLPAQKNKSEVLLNFWKKLSQVTHLTFHATTKNVEEQGWNGKGKGEVSVTKEGDNCLLFQEKGDWQGKAGTEINFRNVFRWTLDRHAGVISLEHLRRGSEHPVFLFHLTPINSHALSSVDSHLCGGDTYFGQIHFDQYGLRLNWRVIGPKKNEELETLYS